METLFSFLPLILIVAIFYFLMIRPQSKQQKELQTMRDNIKPGDEVVTIGGFYGIVYAIDDKNVVLELLPDFNKAMIVKSAIARVITEEESLISDDEPLEDQEISASEDASTETEPESNVDINDKVAEDADEPKASEEGKA